VLLDDVVSTVSPDVRGRLATALREVLRPGGLVAVRYRALAGWAELAPLRTLGLLMTSGMQGSPDEVVAPFLSVLDELRKGGARYVRDRPDVMRLVDEFLSGRDAEAVMAGVLTERLEPLSLAMVTNWIGSAGCVYVAGAQVGDELGHGLSIGVAEMLDDTPDVFAREMLRDLATKAMIRVDVFRRGRMSLTPTEQVERLGAVEMWTLPEEHRRDPGTPHTADATALVKAVAARAGQSWRLDEVAATLGRSDPASLARTLMDRGLAHPLPLDPESVEAVARCQALDTAVPNAIVWGAEAR
jgi:hypothetical protein